MDGGLIFMTKSNVQVALILGAGRSTELVSTDIFYIFQAQHIHCNLTKLVKHFLTSGFAKNGRKATVLLRWLPRGSDGES